MSSNNSKGRRRNRSNRRSLARKLDVEQKTNAPRRIPNKLYIGDLSENMTKEILEREFGRYGRLEEVWLAHNPPGFAFVEFLSSKDASACVQAFDGKLLCGSRIRVEFAKSSGVPQAVPRRLRTRDRPIIGLMSSSSSSLGLQGRISPLLRIGRQGKAPSTLLGSIPPLMPLLRKSSSSPTRRLGRDDQRLKEIEPLNVWMADRRPSPIPLLPAPRYHRSPGDRERSPTIIPPPLLSPSLTRDLHRVYPPLLPPPPLTSSYSSRRSERSPPLRVHSSRSPSSYTRLTGRRGSSSPLHRSRLLGRTPPLPLPLPSDRSPVQDRRYSRSRSPQRNRIMSRRSGSRCSSVGSGRRVRRNSPISSDRRVKRERMSPPRGYREPLEQHCRMRSNTSSPSRQIKRERRSSSSSSSQRRRTRYRSGSGSMHSIHRNSPPPSKTLKRPSAEKRFLGGRSPSPLVSSLRIKKERKSNSVDYGDKRERLPDHNKRMRSPYDDNRRRSPLSPSHSSGRGRKSPSGRDGSPWMYQRGSHGRSPAGRQLPSSPSPGAFRRETSGGRSSISLQRKSSKVGGGTYLRESRRPSSGSPPLAYRRSPASPERPSSLSPRAYRRHSSGSRPSSRSTSPYHRRGLTHPLHGLTRGRGPLPLPPPPPPPPPLLPRGTFGRTPSRSPHSVKRSKNGRHSSRSSSHFNRRRISRSPFARRSPSPRQIQGRGSQSKGSLLHHQGGRVGSDIRWTASPSAAAATRSIYGRKSPSSSPSNDVYVSPFQQLRKAIRLASATQKRKNSSRSPVGQRRSRSPMGQRRSSSPIGQRRSRSSLRQRRSRSPIGQRRSRSPIGQRRSRSRIGQGRSRSPMGQRRSRSPIGQGRSRSPIGQGRSRSPIGQRRSRSPLGQRRSRSSIGQRRSRSPISQKRSKSPIGRGWSRHSRSQSNGKMNSHRDYSPPPMNPSKAKMTWTEERRRGRRSPPPPPTSPPVQHHKHKLRKMKI